MQTTTPTPNLPFAEPTPLGLFGLSIGCGALLPIAFGVKEAMTPDALHICAWFCLLFGAGCQFLAGMMSFANKNLLGGTLLTTFSFNWVMNWWALDGIAHGKVPDATIVMAVDAAFLLVFVVLAFAFALHSKLLFALLADIVALYVLRLAHVHGAPIGVTTIILALIAVYVALAILVNDAAGRVLMPLGGPLLQLRNPPVPETPRAIAGSASLQMS